MKYNIYLRNDAENALQLIFEYLKLCGDIPVNAIEVGDYRSQCLTYAVFSCIGRLAADDPIFKEMVNHEHS